MKGCGRGFNYLIIEYTVVIFNKEKYCYVQNAKQNKNQTEIKNE